MIRLLSLFTFVILCLCAVHHRAAIADEASRPNIVWILSEDNSIHYSRLYGYPLGGQPNIEALAAEGLVFEHAFSNAPVCSVARTTVMTGMLAPRVGFQFHRKSKMANLPAGAKMFPAYLRDAGYYTTNNSKTDYNVVTGKVWDETSRKATWRNRPSPETPFFHMQTFGVSHESSLHFKRSPGDVKQLTTSPDDVPLAPYHPDTELFRYTYARYYDRMHENDRQVKRIVDQLKEDGLFEETIIFYFGDHGGVLPRSKGYVYESGLHVPLVVYVPEKWRHLMIGAAGDRVEGFVSFIDFGPTVLNLAGVAVPESMDGRPFLGEGTTLEAVNQRDTAFGYADRFDEKYDMVRSLRKGRYKYLRNFTPHYPDGLQNNYRYKMLAYEEWRRKFKAGALNAEQSHFFQPRPPEQLFDIEQDPHEVHDLAKDPAYNEILVELRHAMTEKMKSMPDLSMYPESYLVDNALEDGVAFGQAHKAEIGELIDLANLMFASPEEAMEPVEAALTSENAMQRYWAATVLCAWQVEQPLPELSFELWTLMKDPHPLVAMRGAEIIAKAQSRRPPNKFAYNPAFFLRSYINKSESNVENLILLNSAVYLQDFLGVEFEFDASYIQSKGGEVGRRLEYFGVAVEKGKKRKGK